MVQGKQPKNSFYFTSNTQNAAYMNLFSCIYEFVSLIIYRCMLCLWTTSWIAIQQDERLKALNRISLIIINYMSWFFFLVQEACRVSTLFVQVAVHITCSLETSAQNVVVLSGYVFILQILSAHACIYSDQLNFCWWVEHVRHLDYFCSFVFYTSHLWSMCDTMVEHSQYRHWKQFRKQ